MARIFSVLAVLALLLLVTNFVVGLIGGDFNAAAQNKRETHNRLIEVQRQSRARGQRASQELETALNAAQAAEEQFRVPRARMTLHMLLGAAAALLTVLVNSITITYFIGTSRWCKEVCETYGLHGDLVERSTQLKRGTFPWALAGILSVIGIVGLGAAADPSGANWPRAAALVMPHYIAAMVGIAVVAFSFVVQIGRIAENYSVIDAIMAEVEKARAHQGLPIEEPTAP